VDLRVHKVRRALPELAPKAQRAQQVLKAQPVSQRPSSLTEPEPL
jgi:hypothetical protein